MALTITGGVSVLRLLNNLQKVESQRAITLARISTQQRINKASDDPAGLIAVNALHRDLASVNAAIENNQRSTAMLDTASGALTEVSDLLVEIQGLAVASAGNTLSAEELAANQSQIDSAIESIDRIVNGASFNGQYLFTGANLISTSMSAADASAIKDVRVYSRGPQSGSTTLTIKVTAAATHATTSGTSIAQIAGSLSEDTTLVVSGQEGAATITLTSGSGLASVVSQINAYKGQTGVSATTSGVELKLTSVDFGTDAFVSVTGISGDPAIVASANASAAGTDAVVTVNGSNAAVSGTEFYYAANGLSLSANLATNSTGTRTITITGGGAALQVGTNLSAKAVLGMGALSSGFLGRSDLGYLSSLKSGGSASLLNDPAGAALIARKAAGQVASQAGRLGAFTKYTLASSTNALLIHKEALASAISAINDVDVAAETSALERENILTSAGLSLLDAIFTQQKTVLDLLRG